MTEQCALLARELREPLAGTAPEATGWLCIEQPGRWGARTPADSDLPREVVDHLASLTAAQPDIRVQLIRSEGRRRGQPRAAFLAHAGPTRRWLRRVTFGDPRELLDLPLASVTGTTPPPDGDDHADPLVLVCTHAKRDACCALWGRPVADALNAEHPELVWSSSHLGGHRFAGNLVVLPAGLAYGFLQPADALRVVRRHLDGHIDLEHLRGRSGLDRAAQTAEWFVRERTAARGLDEVVVRDRGTTTDGAVTLEVDALGDPWTVTVRHGPLGSGRATSCGGEDQDPGTWSLVDLRPARV